MIVESTIEMSRREQLLAIASQMFATRGFAGTGVDDLGQAAGITGSALYRYFPSKQAILDALMLEGMNRLLGAARQAAQPETDAGAWLDRLIKMRIDYAYGPDRYAFVIRRNEHDNISRAALRKLAAMEDVYWAEWMRVMTTLRPGVSTPALRRAIHAVHLFVGYIALEEHVDDVAEVRLHIATIVRAALFA